MWVKLIFVIVLIGYCSCKNRTYEEVHLELTSPLPTADEKGKVMIQHSVDTFHLYGKNEMRLGKTPHYFYQQIMFLIFYNLIQKTGSGSGTSI